MSQIRNKERVLSYIYIYFLVEDMLGDEEFMRELLESANVDLENEDIQKLLKKKDDKSDDKKDDKKQ